MLWGCLRGVSMVSSDVEEPPTKFTCGTAPWNRYVFTRVANKSFRQNEVFSGEKTVLKGKTNVKKAQTRGRNTKK